MKIRIRDVVAGGHQVEYTIKPVDIGLENEDFLDPEKPLKVSADLQKADNVLIAQVHVVYTREAFCARCLEHFSRPAAVQHEIDFEIVPGDEWVDLGERVREEMIMEDMPRVLCRANCLGICPDCGADLNTEKCQCDVPLNGVVKKKRSR